MIQYNRRKSVLISACRDFREFGNFRENKMRENTLVSLAKIIANVDLKHY